MHVEVSGHSGCLAMRGPTQGPCLGFQRLFIRSLTPAGYRAMTTYRGASTMLGLADSADCLATVPTESSDDKAASDLPHEDEPRSQPYVSSSGSVFGLDDRLEANVSTA